MAEKGIQVSLSFDNSSGEEQPRRHSFTDSSQDFVGDNNSRDLFGKDVVDEEEGGGGEEEEDHAAGGFAWGLVGSQTSTNPFSNYHVPRKRWSPKKTSSGTALARRVRGIRSSPKPVTSLESCLRAHISTTNRVVNRALCFSSILVEEGGILEVDSEISSEVVSKQTALPNLPNLSKCFKEHAAKLISVVTSSSDRGSNNNNSDNNTPSSPNDSICSKRPCFETLLFSYGVGLGVLFASGAHKLEVKRLSQLLDQTQVDLEALKWELARRNLSPASRIHTFGSARQGKVSEGQHSVRSYYGSEQQEDQMAELEAELEAELDQLTLGDSATMASQYSAVDELDMDASVVFGDLEPTDLPAGGEESSKEDQSPPGQQPACLNHYAVSPRELTRLLRKLQTTRQDKLIAELEDDLEAALSTVQSRDRELELWKDRVKRLTKVSFVATSGDEYLTPRSPTEGIMALVDTVSVSREEEAILELSSANCGTVSAGSHPSSGTQLGDHAKLSNLHTSVSAKQEPQAMSNYSQAEVIANPILDHAEIITQLMDSVHGLESCGLLLSSSSSDSLDEFTPDARLGFGDSLPLRAKLVGQLHPYNFDVGNHNPVLAVRKKLKRNENYPPSFKDADPDGRCHNTVAMESSLKCLSDMPEDADCCRTATETTPCSVKYVDYLRPAARVSNPDAPLWAVGRAGLTTPVEKVRQQLWSGEQSPTVLEKIARWEGLVEREMPGPATRSNWWEGQSQDDIGNYVLCEENLELEAEEMLIKRIVESKSRLRSDSLVKKAQSALAMLERDDGVEVDACHGDDTFADKSIRKNMRPREGPFVDSGY